MPQIFVKMSPGKTVTVEVEVNTTAAEVIRKLVETGKLPAQAVARLQLSRGTQGNDRMGDATAVGEEVEFSLAVRAQEAQVRPVPDEDVTLLLRIRLERYVQHPPENTFVLISIASFVHGDKGAKEAEFQQCPADVVEHCARSGLRLVVILADNGFGNGQGKQLYDFDARWQPDTELLGGKVRHFKFTETRNALSTYATVVDWEGAGVAVAGVNVAGMGAALERAGGHLLVRSYNGDIHYRSNACPVLGRTYH